MDTTNENKTDASHTRLTIGSPLPSVASLNNLPRIFPSSPPRCYFCNRLFLDGERIVYVAVDEAMERFADARPRGGLSPYLQPPFQIPVNPLCASRHVPFESIVPTPCPFTVIVDTREQAPYSFTNMVANADEDHHPILVPTKFEGLPTGDYSIAGFESLLCIERKELSDLYHTLGQGRDRFQREHERMAEMVARGGYCSVVIEADWETILNNPPPRARVNPKVIFRTALSWQVKYGVQWQTCGGRRLAEIMTFRLLENFWKSKRGEGDKESGEQGDGEQNSDCDTNESETNSFDESLEELFA